MERLSNTCARIAERHEISADLKNPDPTALEHLRELLSATPADIVPNLAGRLRRQELDLLADLVAIETISGIARKAVSLAAAAPSKRLARRCWHLLVTRGGSSQLTPLLKALTRDERFLSAVVPEIESRSRFDSWLSDDGLSVGLLGDLEGSQQRKVAAWLQDLPPLSEPIVEDSALFRELMTKLLTTGSRALLASQGTSTLERWLDASPTRVRHEFSIHYVVTFRADRAWSEDLADRVVREIGHPQANAKSTSWRSIEARSAGAGIDFANWIALRELKEFFGSIDDPHGRFKFWERGFGTQIVRVARVAEGEAAMLHIPPLLVIEFANKGYAAYVYAEQDWGHFESLRSKNPRVYQERKRLVRHPGNATPYRILHPEGWQSDASRTVTSLLRQRR
ncbi:MAG: hypothetical protein H6748_16030 [Spirochaetaceae bacterium]|nr:hypothetical protein [Spirochaetaceae bacterium]